MWRNKKAYILTIFFIMPFIMTGNIIKAADPTGCCVYKKINTNNRTVLTIYKTSTDKQCKDEAPKDGIEIKRESWVQGQEAMGSKCIDRKTKQSLETSKQNEKTIFTPKISIPGSEFQPGANLELPDSTGMLADYIIAILKYSIGLIGIIATVVLMFAGARWLTAAGNPTIIGEAKTYIISALSGLALTLCSFLLLSMVSSSLTTLNITSVNRIQYISLLVGCCEKTGADGTHAENTPKDMCTAENMPGYTSLVYKGEDYAAENDKCVLVTGCCYIRSKRRILGIPISVKDKMCVKDMKEKACDDEGTGTLKEVVKFILPGGQLLFPSIVTDFNKGKDCSAVSDCEDGVPICKQVAECLNQIKKQGQQ